MGVFQRIGNAMVRFMYGRNGMDQLNRALIFLYLGLCVLRTILLLALESIVPARIADVLLWGVLVGLFFRMFSKNLPRRRGRFLENMQIRINTSTSAVRWDGSCCKTARRSTGWRTLSSAC